MGVGEGVSGSRENCVGSSVSVFEVALRDAEGRQGAGVRSCADGCSTRDAQLGLAGSGGSVGHGPDGCQGHRVCGGRRGRLLPGAYPSRVGAASRRGRGNGYWGRGRDVPTRGRPRRLGATEPEAWGHRTGRDAFLTARWRLCHRNPLIGTSEFFAC